MLRELEFAKNSDKIFSIYFSPIYTTTLIIQQTGKFSDIFYEYRRVLSDYQGWVIELGFSSDQNNLKIREPISTPVSIDDIVKGYNQIGENCFKYMKSRQWITTPIPFRFIQPYEYQSRDIASSCEYKCNVVCKRIFHGEYNVK